jgi:hypothetical protein
MIGEKNVGKEDQVVRIIISIALFALGIIFFSGLFQIIAIVIGIILLLTGIFRTCGMYSLFGINTCKI